MNIPPLFILALCVACALCACSQPEDARSTELGAWFERPSDPWPKMLSTLNVYLDASDLSVTPEGVVGYEPTYPLWSNGSAKTRHIVLPQGTRITPTSDRTSWTYPVGTVLLKTFSFKTPQGLRHIETRVMRKEPQADEWSYAHYLWDESGEDARLLDMRRTVPVDVTLESGQSITHVVPNKLQCRQCHEASPRWVLGLSARQLEGGDQLERMQQVGVFSQPPERPAPLGDAANLDTWAKGYFLGNCTHCHNGWGESINSVYSLYPEDALDNLVNRETEGNASAVGVRMIPGNAQDSVLYQAVAGGDDDMELKAMPPLGVQVIDPQTLELLASWIDSYPSENTP